MAAPDRRCVEVPLQHFHTDPRRLVQGLISVLLKPAQHLYTCAPTRSSSMRSKSRTSSSDAWICILLHSVAKSGALRAERAESSVIFEIIPQSGNAELRQSVASQEWGNLTRQDFREWGNLTRQDFRNLLHIGCGVAGARSDTIHNPQRSLRRAPAPALPFISKSRNQRRFHTIPMRFRFRDERESRSRCSPQTPQLEAYHLCAVA